MTQDELNKILEDHEKWVMGKDGGKRANLTSADLRRADLAGVNLANADLSYAKLRYANLSDVDLSHAKLRYANLRDAILERANLRYANLSDVDLRDAILKHANLADADLEDANLADADLSYAKLRYANLRDVDLRDAKLRYANLRDAGLSNCKFSLDIPKIENIDLKIYNAINGDNGKLDMDEWHTCGTNHCRAGWAIHLAGELGYELEQKTSPYLAGRLIYEKSRPRIPAPDFFTTNREALQSIKKDAGVCDKKPKGI